jgi:hypothetical protein
VNLHGGCEACGCQSVVSTELLALMQLTRVSVDYPPIRSNQILGRMGQA